MLAIHEIYFAVNKRPWKIAPPPPPPFHPAPHPVDGVVVVVVVELSLHNSNEFHHKIITLYASTYVLVIICLPGEYTGYTR